jgi:pimeloyl-ACP methyl ester carboxylesterase
MRARFTAIAGAALLAATALVPASVPAATAGTRDAGSGAGSTLSWGPCPTPGAPVELQCASLAVPVDYAHPHGPTTSVTVNRLRSTGAHPLGSLLFDPGGPGGSGTEVVFAESLGLGFFTAATREHFDLIGVDPRGVGLSSPVRCDPALLNERVSLFPRNEAEFRRLVAHNRALGNSCRRLTGPLLGHVDTVSAARDLEAVRRALGQGRLNYLGLSYGSQLGQTYASLYPHRFRTLALDGALDHSVMPITLFRDESHAYDDSFDRFVAWCARTTGCALHGQDVAALFDRVLATAARTPIPAPRCAAQGGCRPEVTAEDIRFNVQRLLLFPTPIPFIADNGWNDLAIAIQQADAGDASVLSSPLAASDADPAMNGWAIAIECLDWPTPIRTLADVRRLQALGRAISPRFGGASQSWTVLAGCVGWPAPVVNPPRPFTARTVTPILITNATHDPSTPYPWALSLARRLPSSVLVTRNGDGHTTYLTRQPSHTQAAIDAYLATGRTPPRGTVFDD